MQPAAPKRTPPSQKPIVRLNRRCTAFAAGGGFKGGQTTRCGSPRLEGMVASDVFRKLFICKSLNHQESEASSYFFTSRSNDRHCKRSGSYLAFLPMSERYRFLISFIPPPANAP